MSHNARVTNHDDNTTRVAGRGSFAGFELRETEFPSGAIFKLAEPPLRNVNVTFGDNVAASLRANVPYVIVRLPADHSRHTLAKSTALQVAQRLLDLLSAVGHCDLELIEIRGDEHHLVWWRTARGVPTIRWTTIFNYPPDLLQTVFQNLHDRAMAAIPPGVTVAPPPDLPNWHPSFRYFRNSQLSDDLVEAFRNAFLAVESVLDHVLPAAGAGLNETEWIAAALDKALAGVNLEGWFDRRPPSQSVTSHIVSTYYRRHRGSLFHSKLSYGPDNLRLPHLETEQTVEPLEEALEALRFLYLKLARTHLQLDHRAGFYLAQTGFDMLSQVLVGQLTIYLTDDPNPVAERLDDTILNPRQRWQQPMVTRNARKLERRLTRVFLGYAKGADLPDDHVIRGIVAGVDAIPAMGADFDGHELRVPAGTRLEVALGVTALNHGNQRRSFRT